MPAHTKNVYYAGLIGKETEMIGGEGTGEGKIGQYDTISSVYAFDCKAYSIFINNHILHSFH